MLEEQHREGEKSDWVWLPHTANSILGTLVRLRIGGALQVYLVKKPVNFGPHFLVNESETR